MAYIYKPIKKKVRTRTEKRELRQKYYTSTLWRRLRNSYFMNHPLCERCLENGETTAAQDIHHIFSPFAEGVDTKAVFYDPDNLYALCKECHGYIHSHKLEESLHNIYFKRKGIL